MRRRSRAEGAQTSAQTGAQHKAAAQTGAQHEAAKLAERWAREGRKAGGGQVREAQGDRKLGGSMVG